jgi:hypothetical protein
MVRLRHRSTVRSGRSIPVAFVVLIGMGTGTASAETICHYPPGNPSNVQLITVGGKAAAAHVANHGDAICAEGDSDCCGPVCTNLETDADNCGTCGNACEAGASCVDGACITPVCGPFQGTGCYWMENFSGNFCWVPSPFGFPSDISTCQFLDSCGAGGGGGSGGGCYKWATCSDCPGVPW